MSHNTPSNKRPSSRKKLLQIAAKPFIFILFLIMICAFLAHYLVGSETLEDYAKNNPELAYRTEGQSADKIQTVDEEQTDDALNTPEDQNINDTETPDESFAYNISEAAGEMSESVPEEGTITPFSASEENDDMTTNPDRITYQNGFYYEPLDESIKQRITGISYPVTGCTVPYEDLRYVGLIYIDFDGEEQTGELICNKAIAQDMVEIFYELYRNDYRIERIRLVDEYGGDDTLSMLDNNTSCFNYRVVDGTTTLSKHALGCAIDINPFYNPYIVYNKNGSGETYISPKGSEIYADRSQDFPYKIDENDLCYKLFTDRGFTWGGNWNSTKDYQHFQIVLP